MVENVRHTQKNKKQGGLFSCSGMEERDIHEQRRKCNLTLLFI